MGHDLQRTHAQAAVVARSWGPSIDKFIWGVGIESSSIPHLDVDQFEWTQHNQTWRSDLKLVRDELGLRHLRYSVPWHYVEPVRGCYDWSISDQRLGFCQQLGLQVTLDIMHFGTPRWLPQAVGDPEFPEALEEFVEAMVERYRGSVRVWCPVNEPLVTALFSGDYGLWPPHSRKWRGYFPVLARMAMATARAIRAVRRTQPEAVVLLCDAADHFKARDPSLAEEVNRRNLRRFLLLDLITGRVDANHPLYAWATSYGMTELDLQWFRQHPQAPDVIGLDYYAHSDWQLEPAAGGVRQRRAENPAGLYGVARDYYNRYALPLMVTETSIEGKPINRQIWLEKMVDDVSRLRREGLPLLGLVWWPLFDHLDWDGALTHRIGKLHQVGLYKLLRSASGALQRIKTPLAEQFASLASRGNDAVGEMESVLLPLSLDGEQLPPLGAWQPTPASATAAATASAAGAGGNGDGPAAALPGAGQQGPASAVLEVVEAQEPGIVVFSHLRWGFVWQRPQQFLSRFARTQPVLFVEEPFFDLAEGLKPEVRLHQVMPNVTVASMHGPDSWSRHPQLPQDLLRLTQEAIAMVGDEPHFRRPLLWYYSPGDAAWSLGRLPHRGVVYDCMDELSQFSGAPEHLSATEQWLMQHADVVFTGGKSLWARKSQSHDNVHFFGCGVEAEHFALAREEDTVIPPDIDFIARPIFGWFGVIDERVDYHLVAQVAALKPEWSFAMVGPIVKVDPNLLPHSPNLYWLGPRDYSVLPNYCKAFTICMMCFAINKATEFINPTKALEYLATGRPIISTPIQDVIAQYDGLIDVVSTAEQFIAAAQRLLSSPDPQRIARGIELAKASAWDSVVDQMRVLIKEGISRADRRSALPIEPPAVIQLSYQYKRTPGS
jgi:beta-glucosidase/6-phospho-beta-glucosidase/beta-galactosidase/glycosyltransferase involved in cell wall biosynthesis